MLPQSKYFPEKSFKLKDSLSVISPKKLGAFVLSFTSRIIRIKKNERKYSCNSYTHEIRLFG